MRGNEDRENGRKEGSGREECEKPGRKTGRKLQKGERED